MPLTQIIGILQDVHFNMRPCSSQLEIEFVKALRKAEKKSAAKIKQIQKLYKELEELAESSGAPLQIEFSEVYVPRSMKILFKEISPQICYDITGVEISSYKGDGCWQSSSDMC
jgi:hypothetical protein